MKCLSLWQPWGTLMAIGEKRIETRSWSTDYRGPLAIHAAKRWTREEADTCQMEPFCSVLEDYYGLHAEDAPSFRDVLPFGAILGECHLAECVPTELCEIVDWLPKGYHIEEDAKRGRITRVLLSAREYDFGNYEAGRFAWLTDSVVARRTPLLYRGQQGLFDIPDDLLINGD